MQSEPEPQQPPAPSPPTLPTLTALSADLQASLERWAPVAVEGVDPSLHYLPPHVSKTHWDELGNAVSSREKGCAGSVSGERWISLRLDGSGFSAAVRTMRKLGVLEPQGFSERFASAMVVCTRGLMEKFGGVLGFTQSDEMIVFIPPASIVRGEQQCHTRSGRCTKITTLAAGYVTARFIVELSKMVLESGGDLDGLSQVLPHFDCRMGDWDSWEEASALLLWRGHDCCTNGVSDAVHHSGMTGKKQAIGFGTREKVAWLHGHSMLPLPAHQAYGTVLVKVKRRVQGSDPRKPEEVTVALRSRIEQVHGPVLELARTCGFFPGSDVLSEAEREEIAAAEGERKAKKKKNNNPAERAEAAAAAAEARGNPGA